MQTIIRDDDTSFFTSPALLEAVYGQLWAHNIPVCLSVIPAQRADARVKHRPGEPLDPGIARKYRGQAKEFSILDNRDLCGYLNAQASVGLVEIVLHGYAHEYMEFVTDDAALIERKLTEGKRILQEAFPDAPIRAFIAPYDHLSPTALNLVFEHGLNLCTASENLTGMPVDPYRAYCWDDDHKLFVCDEYLFTHRDDPEACLSNARLRLQTAETLIVANHYWCFFYDWEGPKDDLLAAWYQFADELRNQPDRPITTFANAATDQSIQT